MAVSFTKSATEEKLGPAARRGTVFTPGGRPVNECGILMSEPFHPVRVSLFSHWLVLCIPCFYMIYKFSAASR